MQISKKEIIDRYDLYSKVAPDRYIYIRINKGMYGLKQAALLAYLNLKKYLETHGYHPVVGTVGLWKHKTKPTKNFAYAWMTLASSTSQKQMLNIFLIAWQPSTILQLIGRENIIVALL